MDIPKLDDKSNKVYNYRIKFINLFSADNPDLTIKEYIKFSKMAANIKFKECRYDHINFNKIKKYL